MWTCSKYLSGTKEWEAIGELDLPQDCFGDELYDYMEEMGWIDSADDYQYDGDANFIAVCGLTEEKGDFKWEFTE